MSFLPQGYEVPQSSGGGGKYFRPQKGENKVRILTDCITGWLYWNDQDKPVRLAAEPDKLPADLRVKDGKPERIRHFWAMVVYDYQAMQISIWEVTQGTIQEAIATLANDTDWGHPRQYDLKITRTGEGLDTKYNVVPSPIKPVPSEILEAYNETPVDLNALFDGNNPFDATQHSHSMNMSVADTVAAMVSDAKARGIDVKAVCEGAYLPLKASEYDEVQMLKLEDALKPLIEQAKAEALDVDSIPF